RSCSECSRRSGQLLLLLLQLLLFEQTFPSQHSLWWCRIVHGDQTDGAARQGLLAVGASEATVAWDCSGALGARPGAAAADAGVAWICSRVLGILRPAPAARGQTWVSSPSTKKIILFKAAIVDRRR